MKKIQLSKNIDIPILGLGTLRMLGEECVKGILNALEIGYRHIDTADNYGNHREVSKAIKMSGIKREELFITSKIYHDKLRSEDVLESGKRFLEELGVEYLDLLLIHWPNRDVPITETLQAMSALREQGITKALGVANFTKHHLEDVFETGVEINNNQIELHPTFYQKDLEQFCKQNKIVITAYCPLGRAGDLIHPVIDQIAKKYNKTPAQVMLSWIMSKDIVAIPKSANKEHLKENFDSLALTLDLEDIQKLDLLDQESRVVAPPHSDFDY